MAGGAKHNHLMRGVLRARLASLYAPGAVGAALRGRALTVVVALMFASGVALLAYTPLSNWLARQNAGTVITEYDQEVVEANKAELAQVESGALQYNERWKERAQAVDVSSWGEGPLDEGYAQQLDMGDAGVMGHLEIPVLKVNLPIYHGCEEEVLQRGVGHLPQTSLPIGGAGTHAALTAHRGLPSAELFSNLDDLKAGDTFVITVLNQTLTYRVFDIEVVEPDDVSSLMPQDGRDLVTLITCTPYAVNTHRLMVHAERVPGDQPSRAGTPFKLSPYVMGAAGGCAVVAGVIALERLRCARRGRRPIGRHASAPHPFDWLHAWFDRHLQ